MGHSNGFDLLGFGVGGFMSMPVWLGVLLPVLIVWMLFWKGLALWHAAQRGQHLWFIAFLLVNTLGILEIVYLFGFLKLRTQDFFTSRVTEATHSNVDSRA